MQQEPTPIEQMEMAFGSLVENMKAMIATLPPSDDVRASMAELEAAIKQHQGEKNGTRH